MCFCGNVPQLDSTTRVVILQHTRERDMAIGTARMASLCLTNAELHVGVDWSDNPALARALSDPSRPPVLLYPGPDARDILRDPPSGPVTLVVVDGTWAQARSVVRKNPILGALPRYAFTTPEPTRYRIRKEPRAEYCSTIEALVHVLGVLERDPEKFRALLPPFEAMIDAQIAAASIAGAPRSRRPRAPTPRLPRELATRWNDLLCVVGEASSWPYWQGKPTRPSELLHWLAYRPADGSLFNAIARPVGELAPNTTFHAELTADQIAAGVPAADLVRDFAAFVRPSDIVCSWGDYAPTLFTAHGGALPDARLDVRLTAQRQVQRKVGPLETYAGDVTPLAPGRGGRRLTMLAKVLERWRAELLGP